MTLHMLERWPALLVIATLTSLTACRSGPTAVDMPDAPDESIAELRESPDATGPGRPADPAGEPGEGDGLAPLDPTRLAGQLVAITASQAGVSNRANRFDIATGVRETLWVTADGANVTDWTLSPDGQRVAYRVIQRAPGEPAIADEQIVVQDLKPDAEARILASVDTAVARMAGFGWSADSNNLAYGMQRGGLPGAGPDSYGAAPSFELHLVAAGSDAGPILDDRVIWRKSDGSIAQLPLTLIAWDPEAGRAAILEQAADSGFVTRLQVLDTTSGNILSEWSPTNSSATVTAASDGRRLALMDYSPAGREVTVSVIDLAATEPRRVQGMADGPRGERWGTRALWSLDSRRLAVDAQAYAAPGSGMVFDAPLIEVIELDREISSRMLAVAGEITASAIAFSPDARQLLVGVPDDDNLYWAALEVHDLDSGARASLDWTLPEDTWAIYWTD